MPKLPNYQTWRQRASVPAVGTRQLTLGDEAMANCGELLTLTRDHVRALEGACRAMQRELEREGLGATTWAARQHALAADAVARIARHVQGRPA